MKLRNKKTGMIYDSWGIYIQGEEITSVKQFNDTFEDYDPKEPLSKKNKTIRYNIVRHSSCVGLEVIVNGMLTHGWKPLGGLILDDSNLRFIQPMIKEDYEED